MTRPLRVLLVEDNPADVLFMQETLKETGIKYTMEVLEDGEAAIEYFQNLVKTSMSSKPDLVILDLNLPKRNGIEVLEAMHAMPELPKLPIAVLTTSDNVDDKARVQAQNVSFLTKPARLENLFFQVLENLGLAGLPQPSRQQILNSKQAKVILEANLSNILLVEDNPTDVLLIKAFLSEARQNSKLVTAETLAEACEVLHRETVSIVLADLGLPDGQGLEVLTQLRLVNDEVPLIVLTGLDDEQMAVDAVAQGAQDYLVKGQIDGRSLLKAMRYAVTRKQAEDFAIKSLASENALLQEILEHSPMGLARFNSDLLITACNLSFAAQLRTDQSELLGKNISTTVAATDRTLWLKTVKNGEPFRVDSCKVGEDDDENDIIWDLTVWPTSSRGGEGTGGIALALDISERQKLEKQREDFAAALAHDIKNPLIGADRVLTFLASSKTTEKVLGEMVALLRESNNSVLSMVQNLVDIHSYESDTAALFFAPLSIDHMLRSAIAANSLAAADKKIQIEKNWHEDLPVIKADSATMQSLFSILLQHAIKFSQSGETVQLNADKIDNFVLVEIVYDGHGVSGEEQEQFFKRFGESKKSNYKGGAGTGLAFYLCKKIVDANNGLISCENSGHSSTKFALKFPVVESFSP